MIGRLARALGLLAAVTCCVSCSRHPHAPGRLIAVDGRRLHLLCAGSGSPVVVFESGFSNDHTVWTGVQRRVAEFTRACSYDRPGLGWSDPSPMPRDSEHIAGELHALLGAAGVTGGFVLVGHSLGACHVLVFAHRYRDETVAMILVDPTPARAWADPPSSWATLKTSYEEMLGRSTREVVRQEALGIEPSVRQAAAIDLDAAPLVLLEARKSGPESVFPTTLGAFVPRGYDLSAAGRAMQASTFADHADLVASLAHASLIQVDDSAHYIQLERAGLVADVIRRTVDDLRRLR